MKKHKFAEGATVPTPRNSHTITLSKDGRSAYIFGGANPDGPLNDLYKLNLENLEFTQVKLSGKTMPMVEMHTSHFYNENQLLIIGGRGINPGQSLEEAEF